MDFYDMRERRPLFGYGLECCGASAVYQSACERADFLKCFDTLWYIYTAVERICSILFAMILRPTIYIIITIDNIV